MRVNRCDWVCMGVLRCRGHERTHKHCKRVKTGHDNPNLDPMEGEIAPDIMFVRFGKMYTNVCRCVQMGTTGYMAMVSVKNMAKRDSNSREGHF